MKNKNLILSAALAAVFSASTAFAEAEVTGKIVHESAQFTDSGTSIGALNAHGSDAFKTETSARIFVDGEVSDAATYHVELQGFSDSEAVGKHDSNDDYTQRDLLREAYVDTTVGDWSIRAGKQQVVWGTADGMKLLDTINPTDYSEMAQNQMEDSRIPVWMINAEKTNEDGSEFQMVVSQPRENVFAGLDRNIDTSVRQNNVAQEVGNLNDIVYASHSPEHAFTMKGVDSITGGVNGFVSITPDLGSVASQFSGAFDPKINAANTANLSTGNMMGFTVGAFANMTMGEMNYAMMSTAGATATNFAMLAPGFVQAINGVYNFLNPGATTTLTNTASATAIKGWQMLQYGFGPSYSTNLAAWDTVVSTDNVANDTTDNSTMEYMDQTTFKTFNSFINAKSQYKYNMPENEVDAAFRVKKSTNSGLNYSMNYSYNYDKNPIINLSWQNDSGQSLTTTVDTTSYATTTSLFLTDASGNYYGGGAIPTYVDATTTGGATVSWIYAGGTPGSLNGYFYNSTTAATIANSVVLASATSPAYGAAMSTTAFVGTSSAASATYAAGDIARAPTLVYEQKVERAHNIGGSFDYALETASLGPVVIRGEALYQKDVYSPVMDKGQLAIGNLAEALTMVKGDRFKYVLGADITVLTNMMVSAQFIQDRNLDYIDTTTVVNSFNGVSGDRYTADYATMHLTNGFNKAEENKEFYSLFFSKPFGASGEHRWNNIYMFEENDGNWNRFDAEFSVNDDTQATVEWNKYWGDVNTQFGQLDKTSNIQVGVKYSF